MLVIADDLPPAALPGGQPAWSVTDDDALSHRHILTATYSGERPNSLPQVLSLYGFRTALFVGPGFAARDPWLRETADHTVETDGCLSTSLREAAAWRAQTDERTFLVLHAAAAATCPTAPDWSTLDTALPDAEVWVIGASGGGAGLGTAGTRTALRAPLAASDATTLDLLPTLLAGASATIPSDARGTDLRSPTPRRALFLTDGEGQTVAVRTARHLLVARTGGDALTPVSLEDAASGTPIPLEAEDAAPLLQALTAWQQSLSATTARERMGDDAFSRILQDGGYWEASPPPDSP